MNGFTDSNAHLAISAAFTANAISFLIAGYGSVNVKSFHAGTRFPPFFYFSERFYAGENIIANIINSI